MSDGNGRDGDVELPLPRPRDNAIEARGNRRLDRTERQRAVGRQQVFLMGDLGRAPWSAQVLVEHQGGDAEAFAASDSAGQGG